MVVLAGLLLFLVRAVDFAALGLFRVKLTLVLLGAGSALALDASYGFSLAGANRTRLAQAATLP